MPASTRPSDSRCASRSLSTPCSSGWDWIGRGPGHRDLDSAVPRKDGRGADVSRLARARGASRDQTPSRVAPGADGKRLDRARRAGLGGSGCGLALPVTPFHFGPGLALKGAAAPVFSWSAFAAAQVVIDCETVYYMVRGE